jgi:hypothetical protein
MKKIYLALILLFAAIPAVNAQDYDENILKAMRDELNRSMNNLKLESLQEPYYIEYKLRLRHSYNMKSILGSLVESDSTQFSTLSVDVRVGDYQFDNSNFFDIGLSFFGSSDDEENFKSRQIALNPDYESLRRELWLSTDAAYKQAAEIYSKKTASLKNKIRKDTTHDFLKVKPRRTIEIEEYPEYDHRYFEGLVNLLSEVFKSYPEIAISAAGFEYLPETVYYVNSEGMEYIKTRFYTGLEIIGYTQAEDGMPVYNFETAIARTPQGIPSKDSLLKKAGQLAEKIKQFRDADYLEESYSGPVMFENQAAAEMWAQVFAPNFVTQREMLSEGGVSTGERFTAFQRKIGGRVLPEFLSVDAYPKREKHENTQLAGTFPVDDDGIIPEDVNLVTDGYLKNLLSSRIPTRRVRESNGHKRGGAPMLSNIFISSNEEKSVSADSIRGRMMELCKARELPYGIVVKRILNQNIMFTTFFSATYGSFSIPRGNNIIPVIEAYKVYPDGREEPVRGVRGKGFTAQSFKDIILSGNDKFAYNYLAPAVVSSFMSGGDSYISVSIVTPDILFEDGELNIIDEDFSKPPFVESPLSNK